MKRLAIAALLVCLPAASGAAEFHGLETIPAWNDRGDLTVEVSNWTKLSIRVDSLTATLSDGRREPCRWKMSAGAFQLGPTASETVVVASRRSLEECPLGRELFAGREPRTLRFLPVPRDDEEASKRPELPLVTLEAELTRRDRPLGSSSRWSVEPAQR